MSCIKKILCCILFVQGSFTTAQYINWDSFDTVLSNSVSAIYYDSTDGFTYIGGSYYRIDDDTIWGIGRYKNGQWDRMGNGVNWNRTMPFCSTCWPNPVNDIIKYHDTLYITGEFWYSGNTILNGIAWWDGSDWQPIGSGMKDSFSSWGGGKNFEIYNDELYVMGGFDSIAGVAANSIAKYNGSTWQTVFDMPQVDPIPLNPNIIYDMEYYNGELFVGGSFSNISSGIYHIIKWNGTDWVFPGFGAYGIADVSKLFTYQGELYVTGQWSEYYNSNNIGHCIAKYNGTSWIPVGDGAFYYPNSLGAIRCYTIHNNELFLGGSFDVCNSTTAYNVIKYDGDFWCSIDTTFVPGGFPQVMTFIHDTLFMGGSFPANMGMCYCIDENYTDNCSADFTGFEELNQVDFSIYPNPANNHITISVAENTSIPYSIFNMIGEKIQAGTINSYEKQIDISYLPAGIYIFQVNINGKVVQRKLLKM